MKRKKSLLAILVVVIVCLVALSRTIINNNVTTLGQQEEAKAYSTAEELKNSYADATVENPEDSSGNAIDNLEVNAYFLDENGNKKRGTYQTFTIGTGDTHSGEYVTLYVDLGLSQESKGTIRNGRVYIPSCNAIINSTLSAGGVINEVTANNDIKLNEMTVGSSANLSFQMRQCVFSDNGSANKQYYSGENNVIIEGDYIDESGNTKHFSKTIKWQLDWNAETKINIVSIENRLNGNGNLIRLADNRIVALFKVVSTNDGNTILANGEYQMSGFKINGITPEITVSNVNNVAYQYYSMENVEYDETTDTLTWRSVRSGAGEGRFNTTEIHSYVTAIYPATLYENYLKDQTTTVETELSVKAKNMSYVNPNIQYTETSLLTNETPELGTRYTDEKDATLALSFGNYSGNLYQYSTNINEQSKINSELIYYGTNASAGYKETCDLTVNVGGGIVDGVKIDWTNDKQAKHSFIDSAGTYYTHEDIKYYTGVNIISTTFDALGSDGWVKIYDAESGELIGTYTEAGIYTYDTKHEKIRIETSAVANAGIISLHNYVEIDNEKLEDTYSQTEFETFTKLATSSNGYIKLNGDESYSDPNGSYAIVDYTSGVMKLQAATAVNADTYDKSTINYSAVIDVNGYNITSSQSSISYYKNPKLLVEFPSTIKSKNTKYVEDTLRVTSGGKEMDASITGRKTKNGKDYFIISINGDATEKINISASFDVVPNTTVIKSSTDKTDKYIRTFANTTYDGTTIIGNVKGAWWDDATGEDTYDWNDNDITTAGDYFYSNTEIVFTEPVGIRVVQSLVLEGSEEEVLSPDIMELDKSEDAGKTVTVNNYLYNYSDGVLKSLKFVGRIPFKGNSFIKSEDSMGSTFDTIMTSEINIPDELKENVTVKYSTEEIDINGIESVSDVLASKYNWTTTFNSNAKSYMIDFGSTDIDKGSAYNFTYTIKLPDSLDYGLASYTSDAIVYNTWEEEKEVFALPVESAKVGLSIEAPYTVDIDFIKVDKDDETKELTGAKYTLTRVDGEKIKQGEEWVDSVTIGSDTSSSFSVTGLYPDVEYKLEETNVPENYKSQDVTFKIDVDDGSFDVTSGETGTITTVSTSDTLNKYQVKLVDELDIANYKVEYYYQNIDGTYSQKTTRTSVTRSGTIGTEVEATSDDKDPKDSNYTLSSNESAVESVIVTADGEATLKVYFDLKTVNYTVEYYYQNLDGTYSQKTIRPSVTRADKIGQTVELTEDDEDPKDSNYTLSSNESAVESATVNADGSTTLKVYFDIKEVNYTVEYYFLNDDGTYPKDYVSKVTSSEKVKVGTEISRNQINTDPNKVTNKPTGNYLLDDENTITTEKTDDSLVITTDESKNVFKVYFTKAYTVTYKTEDPGTFETKSQSDIPYGTATPLLITDKTSRAGYTFTGWLEEGTQSPLLQDATISSTTVTKDITYVAQWKANENTTYQVQFYYQENGEYPDKPFAKVDRTATTDTTVKLSVPSKVNDLTVKVTDSKVTDEDISKPKTGSNYVYDTEASNVIEDNVDGDGSAILKVYFKEISVNYNFDAVLKDTNNKTLTRNQFTITRAGTSTDETILWNKKAISESVEINENNLLIDTYTYKITENETPNEKYVNILDGKYVSVVVAISDEGKPTISSYTIHNDDGTEIDKNDPAYEYLNVTMETVADIDTISVKVINPVRFTFEVEKKDSEGNSLENTGISITSDIINEQNAAHKTEIETESKNGLQITESGVVTGETNENGVIKYEETWVNANEYTYEITETETSGNQYVNILDGYKVVVTVKVNADGTLEIVKNGNKNYTIVATESGKTVTDDLYNYVKITVSSNSLKAIIDDTGSVNVEITNPVKFNIDLIKKDSTGKELNGTKFSVTEEGETTPIFDNGDVTNAVEIEEGPIDAGTYTYYIRENSTTSSKYTNILADKYIKLVLKVNGDGEVEILNQDGDDFKVFTENGREVYDYDKVLKFIKVESIVNNDVYTINVKVTNPVGYEVDIETLDTSDNFLDKTNVTIQKESQVIYNGDATTNVEVNETSVEAGTYNYYITQNSIKDDKYINPLDGKYIKAEVAVGADGTLTVNKVELYEGTIGSGRIITSSEILKYLSVTADNTGDSSKLNISIKDPIRFTVELKKVDTEGEVVQDTGVTIKSQIIEEQNASHKDEIYTESKGGLIITDSGEVSGETNDEGIVKYEETWVEANKNENDDYYYTYEITEDEAAGNQYVNVLKGYKVIVRVKVSANGELTLVNENGRAYKASVENKFTIVNAETGKAIDEDDSAYDYVSISVENNSLSAIITETGKLNVEIENPVRFNIDLIKKDTAGNLLSGTKFSVTKEGNDVPLFDNAEVTSDIEVKEDLIDAGVYTYYIREDQTNTTAGDRYVNILKGKYIKLKVKVNGNGVIDILDNEGTKNADYYEVYEDGKTDKVTDDDVLKYISVKSHDTDGDGIYTIDVQVTNPVKYEIDIITLDTLGKFLDGTNVTLYKDENSERKELVKGNATDVSKINQVEKIEIPANAGTYTYYLKENYAKNERYVNVLNGKYIKIQLTVAPNGMLTVTQKLYEGELGQGTEVGSGSVFDYYSVAVDNFGDVSRLNITLKNPVKFVMEVDKYDTAENSLTGTTFEIESPIIEEQKYEHDNEKISGITDGGITSNGVITGITDNAIEESPDGSMQRARISYEETWVNANKTDDDYYTYVIKETKTSGAQYVNMLEGYQIVLKVHVDAEGNLTLKETDGRNYEIVKVDENAEDITDEVYNYVKITVSNNKISATLNTEVINPVRYNIAVYQTIYGNEQVALKNIPVKIQSEFSGDTTLVTDENGYNSMEEAAVWADTYNYKIFQLDEFNGEKVEDEFVNMLDGYYIGIDLSVHSDGVIKTISADGDETTVSYKLYKRQDDGTYKEISFNDTIVDDFVKVKVTTSEDNVCTLNVYITTPEKYDFKLMKTDIDVLNSKLNDSSENMNDVEFSVVVKDSNGEIVLKNTLSGKDAKTEFETINTKDLKTETIDSTDGIILFDNILIEKAGTYTFEITEITPIVEGMIYKDKSESIIVTADIVVESGKYVLKNMQIPQAERYTIANNTKLTGTETQTINVNVSNERIKGQYDLVLNKISKFTNEPLDGAVYKVTVEQEGKENKVLYVADGDVLSKNVIIPYVGDENQDVTGTSTTAFNNIRIETPETYTIKIEEVKAPDTYTKLDDVIELEITTGIEGEYDDAHYVLKEVKLKDGNHDLVSETHSEVTDEEQNINLQIENEFFDLALKQYVTDVNGTEITTRKPEVTVTEDFDNEKVTNAEYKQIKDAQRAYAGQEVIYTIEVFNEGIIDGYAEEIVEHLPEGLEFVDDEINKLYGWEYDETNNEVITNILSKDISEDNVIPAYNKETQTISSKKIQLKLKVSDDVKLKTNLVTIAEITDSLAKDRKETVDRDSKDLVTMPDDTELAEYTENQEDDDDFEKLVIEEFDLAVAKYVKSVNGENCEERWAKLELDPERTEEYKNGVFNGFNYKANNEMLELKQNDTVVYGIKVYNEGSVGAYAKLVEDTIPSGLEFVKDSEINKKYEWKMLDEDGVVTDDVTKAVKVVTEYLADDVIEEISIEDNLLNVEGKIVEVEFKIVEPSTEDRIIENKAEVTKFIDDQGINVKDRDPEEKLSENSEKIYAKTFDLELSQEISSIEITNTKTNEKTVMNSDEIRELAKVDIARSKLKNTNVQIEYTITVKNNGETAGYASEITDYIPEGFTFDANSNPNWVQKDGYITTDVLADELINPGETKEVKLILKWNNSKVGQKTNIAEISKHADENKNSDVVDVDSTPNNKVETEDDLASTNVIITVKTGSVEIAIIAIILGVMAGASLGIVTYKKNKQNKE